MANDQSFSVSYDLPAREAAQPVSGPASLVAFATCELIPIDARMTLAINRENGKQQLLAPAVVEALKTCTTFRSISDHAETLCGSGPESREERAVVQSPFEQLRQAGLLLEARTVCERLNHPVEAAPAPTRVFVLTSDRPAEVERLLQSMLAAGGLTRHDGLYLIDDSKQADNRKANEDLVQRFNTTSARDMHYIGAAAQQRLLDHLIRELPEHEDGIRFLIDAKRWEGLPTYGRARTLSLLLSVGYRALVLDDDVVCQAIRPAVPEEGIGVGSGGVREASFFADRTSLLGAAVPCDASPLDLHARHLGCPLGVAIRDLGGGELKAEGLLNANAAMTAIWRADSPVLVTQCGSWGDPGTGDAHWTLSMSEYSISRLLAAPGGVSHAIESRCAWLGSPRPTIMKTAFMSQMTGLDNSALLPPYFPVFRGEDLLFASMVEAMHPGGAVIDCDFAVPHLPPERARKSLRDPIAGAGSMDLFSTYLTDQIDYTDGNDPPHRLHLLAEDFRRLAAKSTDDLVLDYRRELARRHARKLYTLAQQRRKTQDMNSAAWTGYLDRGIEELQEALQRSWSPADITGTPPEATATSLINDLRILLKGYAGALDAWKAMREHAGGADLMH